jgi:hypothetical protein
MKRRPKRVAMSESRLCIRQESRTHRPKPVALYSFMSDFDIANPRAIWHRRLLSMNHTWDWTSIQRPGRNLALEKGTSNQPLGYCRVKRTL